LGALLPFERLAFYGLVHLVVGPVCGLDSLVFFFFTLTTCCCPSAPGAGWYFPLVPDSGPLVYPTVFHAGLQPPIFYWFFCPRSLPSRVNTLTREDFQSPCWTQTVLLTLLERSYGPSFLCAHVIGHPQPTFLDVFFLALLLREPWSASLPVRDHLFKILTICDNILLVHSLTYKNSIVPFMDLRTNPSVLAPDP